MHRPILAILCLLWLGRTSTESAETLRVNADHGTIAGGWAYADVPLWDLSDEGLLFRLTLAVPSRRDPLTRLLWAHEARWTASIGYARVYNSYDSSTGKFQNPGGHAALFSAGRELRWELPNVAGALTPRLLVEFGAHYATRRFPADGTRANFKLISGVEWARSDQASGRQWSVAITWPHFSNANVLSPNAGYDALGLRFGRDVAF